MCGLVGIFGDRLTKTGEDIFEDLLTIDSIRGPHSTGVAFIHREGPEVSIAKAACLPQDLKWASNYTKLMLRINSALLGHNRFATIGKVNDENAHPFQFEHITGMHNGTVRDKWKFPQGREFETDSEAIINSIAVQGIEETYKLIEGAATLVWWDNKEHSLNFVRNAERPLVFAYTEDQKAIVYASEAWMIRGACARHYVKTQTLLTPKEHLHWSFVIEDGKVEGSYKKLDPFVRIWPTHYHGSQNNSVSRGTSNGPPPGATTRHEKFWREYEARRLAAIQKADQQAAPENKKSKKQMKREAKKARKEQERLVKNQPNTPLSSQERRPNNHHILCYCDDCKGYWKDDTNKNNPLLSEDAGNRIAEAYANEGKREENKKKWKLVKPNGEKHEFRQVYGNLTMNREEFEKAYPLCVFCDADLDFEDEGLGFISEKEAACKTCYESGVVFNLPIHAIH